MPPLPNKKTRISREVGDVTPRCESNMLNDRKRAERGMSAAVDGPCVVSSCPSLNYPSGAVIFMSPTNPAIASNRPFGPTRPESKPPSSTSSRPQAGTHVCNRQPARAGVTREWARSVELIPQVRRRVARAAGASGEAPHQAAHHFATAGTRSEVACAAAPVCTASAAP